MKIIDFERRGNVVRFYLGEYDDKWGWTNPDYKSVSGPEPSETYYGDDWDDCPYEHNAGSVYAEFVKGVRDISFPFDDLVLEPCDGIYCNSPWSKEDMRDRKVPCLIVVPKEIVGDSWHTNFSYWLGADGVKKFYFGDELNPEEEQK